MSKNKKEMLFKIKKLNQDDIMGILIEHFWNEDVDCKNLLSSRAVILGTTGKDLRAICIFGKEDLPIYCESDFEKIDSENDFNGDHSFLENNPSFNFQE